MNLCEECGGNNGDHAVRCSHNPTRPSEADMMNRPKPCPDRVKLVCRRCGHTTWLEADKDDNGHWSIAIHKAQGWVIGTDRIICPQCHAEQSASLHQAHRRALPEIQLELPFMDAVGSFADDPCPRCTARLNDGKCPECGFDEELPIQDYGTLGSEWDNVQAKPWVKPEDPKTGDATAHKTSAKEEPLWVNEAQVREAMGRGLDDVLRACGMTLDPNLGNSLEADLGRVVGALNGGSEGDQSTIAKVGLSVVATLLRKNADYGSSVFKTPCLAPGMGAGDAILVRMSDKVERILQLTDNAAEINETLDDTMRDLAGYAVLWLVHRSR